MYMSRKKRAKKPMPFTFVCFARKVDALRAMKNLDGLVIRKCTIRVSEARFGRYPQEKSAYELKTRKT